jgi:hypothetical protein
VEHWGDELRRGEMNGIEGTKPDRFEHASGVEHGVIEPDEVDIPQQPPCRLDGDWPYRSHCSQDLGSCQAARDAAGLAPEVAAQRPGLGLEDDQLTRADESR